MRRRKAFLAASFIVTAGLGCQKGSDPETIHANPPPPQPRPDPTTSTTATSAPTPTATGPIMNPPAPTADDDDAKSNVHIIHNPDGTCTRVVSVVCPKGVMCNPPPPQTVPCPDAGK